VIQALDSVRSLPDVYRVKTPSLARMRREVSEEFVLDYLTLWIAELNGIVGVKNTMNETQIRYTAKLILQENPLITVADIKYVFDGVASGKYGELYNSLDCPKICSWFRKHWSERLEAAEQQSIVESQEQKMGNQRRSASGRDGAIQEFKQAVERYKNENKPKND